MSMPDFQGKGSTIPVSQNKLLRSSELSLPSFRMLSWSLLLGGWIALGVGTPSITVGPGLAYADSDADADVSAVEGDSARLPARLNVLTYNIAALPGGLLQDVERLARIGVKFPLMGPDVVGFQETFHRKTSSLAIDPRYPFFSWGPDGGSGRVNSGLLALSRYRMLRTAELEYSSCFGMDCFSRKGALLTSVEVPAGEPGRPAQQVDVYHTHLNSAGDETVRLKQLRQLHRMIRAHSPPEVPVVLMGDFNFVPGSWEYRFVQEQMEMRDAYADLRDRNQWSDPELWNGFTFDYRRNSRLMDTFRARYRDSARIDFVWLRGARCANGVAPIEARSARLAFADRDPVVDGHLSDHFGLQMDLEVHTCE